MKDESFEEWDKKMQYKRWDESKLIDDYSKIAKEEEKTENKKIEIRKELEKFWEEEKLHLKQNKHQGCRLEDFAHFYFFDELFSCAYGEKHDMGRFLEILEYMDLYVYYFVKIGKKVLSESNNEL